MQSRFAAVALALLLGLVACEDEGPESGAPEPAATCTATSLDWGFGGDWMLPGTDCLACHRPGGKAISVFSVAGTVFATAACPDGLADATVLVTDSQGTTVELATNEVGNFFTGDTLLPPLSVAVVTAGAVTEMVYPAQSGSCGACHVLDTPLGLVAPGSGN